MGLDAEQHDLLALACAQMRCDGFFAKRGEGHFLEHCGCGAGSLDDAGQRQADALAILLGERHRHTEPAGTTQKLLGQFDGGGT